MTLLNANTTPPGYPLTEDDLRREFPNTSFPRNPDEATVAPFGWHRVAPTPRPADTRTERYEDTAELVDGTWRQAWVARAATAGEQAEWDAAHQPPPDWDGLRNAIRTENGYVGAFDQVTQVDKMAAGLLGPRLDTFELTGNYALFLQSLQASLAALPAQDAAHIGLEFLALSARTNMPAPFIQALEDLFEDLPSGGPGQ